MLTIIILIKKGIYIIHCKQGEEAFLINEIEPD